MIVFNPFAGTALPGKEFRKTISGEQGFPVMSVEENETILKELRRRQRCRERLPPAIMQKRGLLVLKP